MSGDIETCEACGTTRITFDPPIFITEAPACGAVKPGNYANPPGGVPVCDLPAGHDGAHTHLVEYADSWTDE